MGKILKHTRKVMGINEAEALAEALNADTEDGWHYLVEDVDAFDKAVVACYDEENEFVEYL